MMCSHKSHLT